MSKHEAFTELLQRYLDDRLSVPEEQHLFRLLQKNKYRPLLGDIINAKLHQQTASGYSISEQRLKQIEEEILKHTANVKTTNKIKWMAAALCVLVAGAALLMWRMEQKPAVKVAARDSQKQDIIAPQSNRAKIYLSDGTAIDLDSVQNGELALQGNVKLVKLKGGEVSYQVLTGSLQDSHSTNTVANPKGSDIVNIRLSDGSRVWLNAESSITYPVVFAGNERKVILRGEGYFEVSRNPDKKFIVEAGGISTEVLGTHFNINAYENESSVKTTLLEGKIKVVRGERNVVLKPGEEAVSLSAHDMVVRKGNLDQVLAWRQGYFEFDNTELSAIMRQLSRWYDIDIIDQSGNSAKLLGGRISRKLKLAEVLTALETYGPHFKIMGRSVIITAP